MSGDVPSDAADDCAFDASLCLGLKGSDCGNDEERREKSRLKFHVASLILSNANRSCFRFETAPRRWDGKRRI
jgi:hypothetical protein